MDENGVTTMDVRKFCPEMTWSYFGIYTIETIMFGLLGLEMTNYGMQLRYWRCWIFW